MAARRHARARLLPAAVLAIATALPLVAQDAPPQVPASGQLKLMRFAARPYTAFDGTADTKPELSAALDAILRNRAGQGSFDVLEAQSWAEIDARGSPAGRLVDPAPEEAAAVGAQAAVCLYWFEAGGRITLVAKAWDAWQKRLVAGDSASGPDDLTLLNAADSLVAGLLDRLAEAAPRLLADWGGVGPLSLSRSLAFTGPDEGATVSLEGGAALGVISGGKLALPFRPLAVGPEIRFRLEKPGFHPKTFGVAVKDLAPGLRLPALYPRSRFTVLVSADPDMLIDSEHLAFGMGAAFRWLPLDDIWYLQAGYRIGVGRNPSDPSGLLGAGPVGHQLSIEAAVALFTPPDWVVRAFVGAGIGAWITGSGLAGAPVFFDPYVQLPCLSLQLNLHPVVAELECGALIGLGGGANLLPAGLIKGFGLTRFSLGVKL
jgi:hypothetical protein